MKNNTYMFGIIAGATLLASSAMAAGSYSSIDRLPDEGKVTLSGTVSEVDDKDSFILKDSAGKTIDVHTTAAVALDVGDKVTVTGDVKDEALGIGQQIADATITTSRGNSTPMSAPANKSTGAGMPDNENTTRYQSESDDVPGYDVDVDVKKTDRKSTAE